LKRFFEIYVYGNFHIALIAAVCFYLYNERLNQSIIVFLATFFYYNFCGIVSIKNYSMILDNERLMWISKHLTEIIFMCIAAFVLAIFLWIKLFEINSYRLDYLSLIISSALCFIYFFIRRISILKNIIIAIVWILVLHIWSNRDYSFIDLFLLFYLTILSIWYDRATSQTKRALIDILIIAPFLICCIVEYLNFNSFKP
jgi:hypothetical protein